MIKRRGEDIYEETIIRHTVQPRADAADDAGTGTEPDGVAKNKKSFTVPVSIKIGGKIFRVTGMNASAFRGTKVKTLTVRTKYLTKSAVRGSLKGSKVKTVKVRVGKKSDNRKYIKKYRKIFTKKNAGRKVRVK